MTVNGAAAVAGGGALCVPALHNALVSVGFNSAYRQSLVYDVEVSPRRFAALTRSAFRGFNAALVAEIRKARGS